LVFFGCRETIIIRGLRKTIIRTKILIVIIMNLKLTPENRTGLINENRGTLIGSQKISQSQWILTIQSLKGQ